MGTKTNNLGLYLPADGEVGWGDAVNANASVLDVQVVPYKNYINYVITGLLPPQVGANTLQYTVQPGSALINGVVVALASAVAETIPANYIHDVLLNSDGTLTIDAQPAASYSQLKVPSRSQVLICRVQSGATGITGITPMANNYPTATDSQDNGLSVEDFVRHYYIPRNAQAWAANTAYAAGAYYITPAGWIYRVTQGGTSGSTAPDTIYVNGQIGAVPDGTCLSLFDGIDIYEDCFQYAKAGGIEWYFQNMGVAQLVHDLTNYTWNGYTGDLALNYIKQVFQHCVTGRVSSGTYLKGMKVHTAGFIWLATAAGTAAATSPFGTGYAVGSTVTDGTVTWQAVYAYNGSADWFWLDTAVDFQTYKAPDSHDSYASTFAYLLWRYCSVTGSSSWLTGASTQPSGSGTYYTYQQVLTSILTNNLVNQVANDLTYTFQGAVSPVDGSTYNIRFLEDNCESYQGAVAAAAVYGMLGDNADQTTMNTLAGNLKTGILGLYGTSSAGNSFFIYYYGPANPGTDSWTYVDGLAPAPQWYPYLQCQFWPELCGLPFSADIFEGVRAWVAGKWPSWWQDSSKDTTVDGFGALLAVLNWADPRKAMETLRMIEEQHMSGAMADSLFIHDYGCCLRAKERLAPKYAVLVASSTAVTFEDNAGNITTLALPDMTSTGTGALVREDSPTIVSPTITNPPSNITSIPAKADMTAQSANIAVTNLLTPSVNGAYRLSAYVVVTQAATTSSTMPQVQFNWTDPDGTAQTYIATSTDSSNTLTTHGAGEILIYAEGGQPITWQTGSYASSGATAMEYAVHVRAEAL